MAQSADDILKIYIGNLVIENAVMKSQIETLNDEIVKLKVELGQTNKTE